MKNAALPLPSQSTSNPRSQLRQVIGQLPCGGTITMPFSNVGSFYHKWGCFPPFGTDTPVNYTFSGTITISDAGCT